MSENNKTRPQAFRLDDLDDGAQKLTLEPQADAFAAEAPEKFGDSLEQATEKVFDENFLTSGGWTRRLSWSGLAWSAGGGLIVFATGLWIDQTVEALFARAPALGAIGLALAALLALAFAMLIGREIFALFRQRRVARLHRALALAHQTDDSVLARKKIDEVFALFHEREEFSAQRKILVGLEGQIIDGRDLVEITERALMLGPDARARREIAAAAKRVSLVAAISPRAGLDVIFVAFQALRLIRRIAEIYGGRPGLLGAFKLARAVATHLALTGGMALTDGLAQQILGLGLAAKISTRLGEGVVNGALTARIGLSAMAVCRPMPFCASKPPKLADVAPFLLKKPETQP